MKRKSPSIKHPLKRSVTIRLSEDLFNVYERESIRLQIAFSELIRKELARKMTNNKKSLTSNH
jgi:uncharacterized protein (DUF4415 family)